MAARVLLRTKIQKLRLMCFSWLGKWLIRFIGWRDIESNEFRGPISDHVGYHSPDFLTATLATTLAYFNGIAFDELDWVIDNDVGSRSAIPPTLQDLQYENNIAIEAEYNINHDVVEQNKNITIQHIHQVESHIANNGFDEEDITCRNQTCMYSNTTDGVANQRTSKINISLEVLERHYKMSMKDAAKSLDVSVSTLKRICRSYGIERWPNCRKRKANKHEQIPNPENENKIIQNKKDDENKVLSLLREESSSYVTIKAIYGDDIVKFPFSISSGLDDLKEKVCKRLNINIPLLKLKCVDDDGDLVLIACDDALHEIFGNRLSRLVDHNTTFDFSVCDGKL